MFHCDSNTWDCQLAVRPVIFTAKPDWQSNANDVVILELLRISLWISYLE